jgi:hypothetical protein
VTNVSIKPEYAELYNGEQFTGSLKSAPRLHHGAWICELYVPEDLTAITYRLGHLDKLADGAVDLLAQARAAGWNGEVATDAREVTAWTARERVWEMVHIAGHPSAERPGMQLSHEPGQGEWRALEANLGRLPDASERRQFAREFERVLREPSSTNEWPEA